MKLIIQNNKVAGTADTSYTGNETCIAAPADFDITRMSGYVYDPTTATVSITPSGIDWTKAQQVAKLYAAYQTAIAQPVSYTTAPTTTTTAGVTTTTPGVTKTYQSDPQSVANLQAALAGCAAAVATPAGFYWVAADNTHVPFAYADMQGLAAAMFLQGAAAFQKLQALKTQVASATTAAAVQAVVW